jgi:hypothetical protein
MISYDCLKKQKTIPFQNSNWENDPKTSAMWNTVQILTGGYEILTCYMNYIFNCTSDKKTWIYNLGTYPCHVYT